ncbi:MAG: hypothetical protein JKY43_11315 [Phycisphaerales bacterium]|nr:hypothetical protein [Phycisphaerales bacterium]
MQTSHNTRPAFTIIEILILIAIVALFIGVLFPALSGSRCGSGSMNAVTQANLRSLTTGSTNFAADHNDQIFALTSAIQAQDILHKATGRSIELTQAHEPILRLRYSHLVLMDYLTDRQPEPIAASPFDKNLINWQENPLAYLEENNTFPYAQGLPKTAGYDMDPTWTDQAILQLWPFASSYQVVPHAWLDDIYPQYTPSPTSPHHMIQSDNTAPLRGRKLSQVKYPAQKIFIYEEFDYSSERSPLYASDPNARINLAFFDGSVRQEKTSAANSAFNKDNPTAVWQQPYIPLDTFPLPNGGLNDQTLLDLRFRFRWTKQGLQGIDYGPKGFGNP